ncbi:hypothetical protein GCM10023226_16650 [Nocardioides nanhaiensis]|uniref:DNA polymerase III beta sliding clamp central domain-containing protein n=1 Tax=Nocardioides nanhaiensis TaxID=1476871 RepID=A0ABP8W4G1_9ACTN
MAPVLKTIGKDAMLPVLCHARLEVAGSHALLTATDRFAASLSRVRFDHDDARAAVTVHVHRDALTRVLAVFRRPRGRVDPELAVTVTHGRVRFEGMGLAVDVETAGFANFPDVRSLFRQALDTGPAFGGPMRVDFARLAEFRIAHTRNLTTTVAQVPGGPGKPYVVRMGDDYLGLLMPRRLPDTESTPASITDGWTDALTTKEPA